jgi:hypothetical protein
MTVSEESDLPVLYIRACVTICKEPLGLGSAYCSPKHDIVCSTDRGRTIASAQSKSEIVDLILEGVTKANSFKIGARYNRGSN